MVSTIILYQSCSDGINVPEFAIDKLPPSISPPGLIDGFFLRRLAPGLIHGGKSELGTAIRPGAYIILNAFGLFVSGLDSNWFSEKYASGKN